LAARGSCLSQVLDRGVRPLPTAPFLVRRRYLIVVPKVLPAAALAVRRTYLIVVLRFVLRPLLSHLEKYTWQMSRRTE